MRSKWILLILASLFIVSCYDDEHIKTDASEPKFVVNDSDDPVDHYIYEFYKNHGSFILYDYKPEDYKWNISTVLDIEIEKQGSRVALRDGLEYLKMTFLEKYSDEFRKNYFPFKILLADTLSIVKNAVSEKDILATGGLSFMAFGKIREGANEIDRDSLYKITGQIQAIFWSEFLLENEMIFLPETFWNVSDDFYSINLVNEEREIDESITADQVDTKKYGFWAQDTKAMTGNSYCMAPGKTLDVYQFIYMITTHTKDEMDELMQGYTKLQDKYLLLVSHLKSEYGVDIQKFGNAKLIK